MERGCTHWKNLKPLTTPPLLEKRLLRSSSDTEGLQADRRHLAGSHTHREGGTQHKDSSRQRQRLGAIQGSEGQATLWLTHGILERCRVAEGGKMFWKFLEPGFLKRCSGELP